MKARLLGEQHIVRTASQNNSRLLHPLSAPERHTGVRIKWDHRRISYDGSGKIRHCLRFTLGV